MKGFTQHQSQSTKLNSRIDCQCGCNRSFGAGFTLIESMVAIAIVLISIATPLYNASKGLTAARSSSNQLIGSFLAQEGVEFVRRDRDDAYLKAVQDSAADTTATGWSNFLTGDVAPCIAPKRCTLDPWPDITGIPFVQCADAGGSTCESQPLYVEPLSPDGGRYTQSSGGDAKPTLFYRSLQLTSVNGNLNEEKVTSTVTWSFHGQTYTVTIIDHLTSWQ